MKKPGGDLLSPEIQPTIIGAEAFHCPVRNGKEWDHPAVAVRHRLCPSGTRAPSERIPAEEKTLRTRDALTSSTLFCLLSRLFAEAAFPSSTVMGSSRTGN